MSDSLKEQLLKLGFKPPPKPDRSGPRPQRPSGSKGNNPPGRHREPQSPLRPAPGAAPSRPHPPRPTSPALHGSGKSDQEIDLAKAYALRARDEARERERLAREAAEKAREKAERKAKVAALIDGKGMNLAEADEVRHFEYAGKIRRVYVDPSQLAALNIGALAIVQHKGRFLIVERALAESVAAIEPVLIALLVDPDATLDDEALTAVD